MSVVFLSLSFCRLISPSRILPVVFQIIAVRIPSFYLSSLHPSRSLYLGLFFSLFVRLIISVSLRARSPPVFPLSASVWIYLSPPLCLSLVVGQESDLGPINGLSNSHYNTALLLPFLQKARGVKCSQRSDRMKGPITNPAGSVPSLSFFFSLLS